MRRAEAAFVRAVIEVPVEPLAASTAPTEPKPVIVLELADGRRF